MNALDLVVFDLGGTTVVDDGRVPAAFEAALAEHGIVLSTDRLLELRGASKRRAVLELVPAGDDREARAAAVYARFVERLSRANRELGVRAIDGAEDVFRHFRGRGVRVALGTGFEREITAQLVDALRWRGAVDAVVSGDEVSAGRPAPDLILAAMARVGVRDSGRVANVGDTRLDLLAGRAAGVRWNFGVLSGAHDRATLERVPHTALFDSVVGLTTYAFD